MADLQNLKVIEVPSTNEISTWTGCDDDEHIFQLHIREAIVDIAQKDIYCFEFARYDTPGWLEQQVHSHFTKEKGYEVLKTKRFLIVSVQNSSS